MEPNEENLRILRNVSIFMDTPHEALADVVGLMTEEIYSAGMTIFRKGDTGTCMYIIVDGLVRVHDGDRTINLLGKRDVFGEMAALDPEPRSATVTAQQDTRLFRLDQEPLSRLMAERTEVSQGVIHILCQHLRARVKDMVEDYHYIQQFNRVVAAAAEVEAGVYEPESLDEVAQRGDPLGLLARMFQRMVRQVDQREQSFKRQVAELRIEIDEAKKVRQVAEVTETEYFQDLRQRANRLRQHRK